MTDKNKGQFQKGKSGNPNGRTKGVRNKRMTNTQVLQYLGKRKQSYFDAIEQLARDSMQPYSEEFDDVTGEKKVVENKMFDPKLSFNCFKELIGVEIQADIFEYKKAQDKKKVSGGGSPKEENKEDAPDMSGHLKAVK